MGFLLEITEKKVEKLSEHIEQGLRHLGKAMSCVEEWMDEKGMGERRGYGNRSNYGSRYGGGSMGYRDDEDWEDEDEMMGERRGGRRRRSNGRYY